MPYLKANKIKIFYEYEGEGEPLIIVGGFASIHYIWKDFVKPLQNKYKVLIFDSRGFGFTDVTTPPYTVDMLAKDILELMDALKIEKAYVLGHSMGSLILQKMCLDYPKRIKKAILSGTCLKIPYVSLMLLKNVDELFSSNLDKDLVRKMIAPWLYSSEYLKAAGNLEDILDSMRKIEIDPDGYEGQANILRTFDSTSWISKITTEILLLHGKEDIDTPIYCVEEVFKQLNSKNAKLKIIDKAAHMLFFEKPNEIRKIIVDFFN